MPKETKHPYVFKDFPCANSSHGKPLLVTSSLKTPTSHENNAFAHRPLILSQTKLVVDLKHRGGPENLCAQAELEEKGPRLLANSNM